MYKSRCRSLSAAKNCCAACCVRACKSPQKLSCNSATKCWKCSVIGIIFAMGVGLLFGVTLACEAKANLHPLAFTQSKLRHRVFRRGGSMPLATSAWVLRFAQDDLCVLAES